MELEDEKLDAEEKALRMKRLEDLRIENEKRNREMSAADVVDELFGEGVGQQDSSAPSQFAVSYLQFFFCPFREEILINWSLGLRHKKLLHSCRHEFEFFLCVCLQFFL